MFCREVTVSELTFERVVRLLRGLPDKSCQLERSLADNSLNETCNWLRNLVSVEIQRLCLLDAAR